MNVPRMAEEPIRLVPAGNGADRYRFRWSYRQPLLAVFVAAVARVARGVRPTSRT